MSFPPDINSPITQLQFGDEDVSITLRRAWDRALRMLSQRVNKPTFETHLRGLKPLAYSEATDGRGLPVRNVTIGAPSAFTRSWVEGRHAPLIREVLEEIFDGAVVLDFALSPKEGDKPSGVGGAGDPARRAPLPGASHGRGNGASLATTAATRLTAPEANPERLGSTWERSREQGDGITARVDAPPAPRTPASRATPGQSSAAGERVIHPTSDEFAETEAAAHPPARAVPAEPTRTPRIQPAPNADAVRNMPPVLAGRHPDAPEINPRYTFDKFIVGPTNRLAHGGAFAVATSPGARYNPLFIYAPSGLGKTHLLHAIANAQMQKTDGAKQRIAYMSGEAFTAQYVTSIRQHKAEEFRRRLKSVDLWLVDDIQFIAGKEHTKEEFFHAFNALQSAGKQIVICSDRSPRELRALDERLQSRFESGLVADIAPPDLETRLAILQKKAENETTRVPDDVLLYMARLVQSNIRTLEGALVKLVAYASLVNSPVTTKMAEGILERYFIAAGSGLAPVGGLTQTFPSVSPKFDPVGIREGRARATGDDARTGGARDGRVPGGLGNTPSASPEAMPPATKPRPTPDAPNHPPITARTAPATAHGSPLPPLSADLIRRVVAKRYNVPLDELGGKRRDRDVVNARQVAMHLLRELTAISLPGIGQLFGGRDHTTVIHACDRVKAQIGIDDEMRQMVEGILEEMGNPTSGRETPPVPRHAAQTFEQGLFGDK